MRFRFLLVLGLAMFCVACGSSQKYASVRTPRDLELLLAVRLKDEKMVKRKLFQVATRLIEKGDTDGALDIGDMIKGELGVRIYDQVLEELVKTEDKKKIEKAALSLAEKNQGSEDEVEQVKRYSHAAAALTDVGQAQKGISFMRQAVALAKDLSASDRKKVIKDLGVTMGKMENAYIRNWSYQLEWGEGESPLIYAAEEIAKEGNLLAALVWAESLPNVSKVRAFYHIIIELIRQKRIGEAKKTLGRYWEAWEKSPESKISIFGTYAGARCHLYLGEKDEAKDKLLKAIHDPIVMDRRQASYLAEDFLRLGYKEEALEIIEPCIEIAQRAGDYFQLCRIATTLAKAGDAEKAEKLLMESWDVVSNGQRGKKIFQIKKHLIVTLVNIGSVDQAIQCIEQLGEQKDAVLVQLDGISDERVWETILSKFGLVKFSENQYERLDSEIIAALEEKLEKGDVVQMLDYANKQHDSSKREVMFEMLVYRLLKENHLDKALVIAEEMQGEARVQSLLDVASEESDSDASLEIIEKILTDLSKLEASNELEYLFETASILAQKEEGGFSFKGNELKDEILKQLEAQN